MSPAFFASKTVIRNKGTAHTSHSPKKTKKSLPRQEKKILIKNHQFISSLYNAYTACNFQFFPQLPVKIPTPLPSTQGQEFQGALAKRANLQQFLKVCI